MNRIFAALKEITKFLDDRHFKYALIGGLAVGCRGQARTTQHVDLSVWAELGEEHAVIQAVLHQFFARIEDAEAFARIYRNLVVEASNHVSLDIALASFPFEEQMLDRATRVTIRPNFSVNVLSPEDLIVSKAIAGRPQDWIDIQGVLDRTGPRLDYPVIISRLESITGLVDLQDVVPRLEAGRLKSEDLGDIELA